MSLRTRINLIEMNRDWLNGMATAYHYMHRPVHQRSCPFGWAILFDEQLYQADCKPSGFIVFASIHFTRLSGEFGYPGLPTKWQVLSLARLWLHDDLPRNSETCVIGKALKLVQRRWLEVHPPVNICEPYHIRKIISFADTRYHQGVIYRAANFRFAGHTVSQRRHTNTRGSGMDGATLARYVYDLKKPNWKYEDIAGQPVGVQLGLWGEQG